MHPDSGNEAPGFTGALRPRYVRHVAAPPEQVAALLRERLYLPDSQCCGSVTNHVGELCVCEQKRHTWSPKLGLTLEVEGDRTVVVGRYGPMPAVWTLVIFLYACSLTLGISSFVYGFSKWALGESTLAWWGVPVSLLCIAGIYVGSYVGQKLGHDQMDILHHFVDDAVHAAEAGSMPADDGAAAPAVVAAEGSEDAATA